MGNTEGWDCPSVDCIVVLRPTKSRSLYCQMVGRGTRLNPGKTELLLLDFLWLTEKHELCRPAHLIARGAMPFVEQMQACYGRLVTTVAWGHERDHRWVRWLGFRRWPHGDHRIGDSMFLAYERT